jgi:S1-C subfamily serine protease
MNRRAFFITAGIGCFLLIALVALAGVAVLYLPAQVTTITRSTQVEQVQTAFPGAEATQENIPTLTPMVVMETSQITPTTQSAQTSLPEEFKGLYEQLTPGVVNIRVFVQQGSRSGQGEGSGFILDDQGHIVTNNHVVDQAYRVTVIFHNGFEESAQIIGTDADSDLAVLKVESLPDNAHPLSLGDSDQVQPGEWVMAIGNPFGLGGSMSVGVVSATGRTIPSGAASFRIPQAIQTDAAINPGNSGGPLLNLSGEIIGVNAQIASGSSGTNSGVGFAIPANIVRRVVPVLIESGQYQWPWLGVTGGSVNLLIMQANNLDTQQGAYIHQVVSGGPAAQAGLQGTTGTTEVDGIETFVGGDVVIAIDGRQVNDWSDLLVDIAFHQVGDQVELTILRDGQRQTVQVTLQARPENVQQ